MPDEPTRAIWVSERAGARRADVHNEGTRVMSAVGATDDLVDRAPVPASSFHAAFTRNFRSIRQAVSTHEREGVAIVVTSGEGVHATGWLAAGGSQRGSVIGRHSQAELYLPRDPGLSLRHLLVLSSHGDDGARVRVIDARSAGGTTDESGRAFRAIEADGPAFVRAASYSVLCFPTPVGLWPDDADAVWDSLPPRRFVDHTLTAMPAITESAPAPRRRRERETTIVRSTGPTERLGNLLAPGESALGRLTVTGEDGEVDLPIGPAAAARGVFLGRSERCDAGGQGPFSHDSLSRIHALVVLLDGTLHLVDMASTNGTRRGGQRVRGAVSLDGAQDLFMGAVGLRWTPAASGR